MPSQPSEPTLATATSTSLLDGLCARGNDEAWRRFVERYRPTILRYAARVGVPSSDAEDVAQMSLADFSAALREGRYERERGRLRDWLYGFVRLRVRRWRERIRKREVATSDSTDAGERLGAAEAPDELSEAWEAEWRQAVLRQCLEEVRREVEPTTLAAFERFVLDERPAREVAGELGITANAVFGAKRRVLARVREILPLMDQIW